MAKLTDKQFNITLKAITGNSDKLAEMIHSAGMFAVEHANLHGNIGFGTRLIEALGKKHDKQRVVTWLIKFGKFGVSKGQLIYRNRKDITAANVDAILAEAEATPYWELTKQPAIKESVDYLAMLASIITKHKKMEALAASGTKEVEEKNLNVVDEVTKLLEKLNTKAKATVADTMPVELDTGVVGH